VLLLAAPRSTAAGGSVAITELLLAHRLDVNGRDRYGRTPLHYASENGCTNDWMEAAIIDSLRR
jgi:ankyrin repeat protein